MKCVKMADFVLTEHKQPLILCNYCKEASPNIQRYMHHLTECTTKNCAGVKPQVSFKDPSVHLRFPFNANASNRMPFKVRYGSDKREYHVYHYNGLQIIPTDGDQKTRPNVVDLTEDNKQSQSEQQQKPNSFEILENIRVQAGVPDDKAELKHAARNVSLKAKPDAGTKPLQKTGSVKEVKLELESPGKKKSCEKQQQNENVNSAPPVELGKVTEQANCNKNISNDTLHRNKSIKLGATGTQGAAKRLSVNEKPHGSTKTLKRSGCSTITKPTTCNAAIEKLPEKSLEGVSTTQFQVAGGTEPSSVKRIKLEVTSNDQEKLPKREMRNKPINDLRNTSFKTAENVPATIDLTIEPEEEEEAAKICQTKVSDIVQALKKRGLQIVSKKDKDKAKAKLKATTTETDKILERLRMKKDIRIQASKTL